MLLVVSVFELEKENGMKWHVKLCRNFLKAFEPKEK